MYNQFLMDAITLRLPGGVIGLALGIGAAILIADLASWAIFVELEAVLFAFLFSGEIISGEISIFFGWRPAPKAARPEPVEALRME